jgi:hypothetical protein
MQQIKPTIDRSEQDQIAQRLYAADPERHIHGDSTCWVAACFAAYALLANDYSDIRRKTILDYYGSAAVNG